MPRIAVVVHDDLGCHCSAPSVGHQIKAMLLMPHCKKSSASTILTGKQERDSFRRDIIPCCAYAASGQPAAALPIDLMNSLRRMLLPKQPTMPRWRLTSEKCRQQRKSLRSPGGAIDFTQPA